MTNDKEMAIDDIVQACLDAPTGDDCRRIMRQLPQQGWSAFVRAFTAGLEKQGRTGGLVAQSLTPGVEVNQPADVSAPGDIVQGILLRQEKERVLQAERRRRGA